MSRSRVNITGGAGGIIKSIEEFSFSVPDGNHSVPVLVYKSISTVDKNFSIVVPLKGEPESWYNSPVTQSQNCVRARLTTDNQVEMKASKYFVGPQTVKFVVIEFEPSSITTFEEITLDDVSFDLYHNLINTVDLSLAVIYGSLSANSTGGSAKFPIYTSGAQIFVDGTGGNFAQMYSIEFKKSDPYGLSLV